MTDIVPAPTGPAFETNLSAPFLDRARRRPAAPALVFMDNVLSYAQLAAEAAALRAQMAGLGLCAGDRVAYLGWNHPSLVTALLASAQLGAVFVPLNPRSAPAERAEILTDCGARLLLAGAEFQAPIDALRDELEVAFYLGIEQAPAGWTVLATTGDGAALPSPTPTAPEDLAVLLYTSGTTGRPKGVMLSHDNIWATMQNLMLLIQPTSGSTLLGMAPMFHVAALVLALATFATGGQLVMLPAFRPDLVFAALRRWPVTWTFGVPTMLQGLQAAPDFDPKDFRDVLVLAAGAPVPMTLLKSWTDAGARIAQGYGQSEAAGGTTLLDPEDAATRLGSAGLPFPLTELELRETDSGTRVSTPDVEGQIWIRGRNVTTGYWNRQEETVAAFDADGWFATGDAGRYDTHGHLYIVDRIKDMIISGGVNIYPAEVESAITGHPSVAQVAVIGLPDAQWGETVTAVVVPAAGATPTLDEIAAYCGERLGRYKCPRRLECIEALPMNAAGKILKRALRERYAAA